MKFLIAPHSRLVAYRRILWDTSMTELRSTYAGSVLGLAWVVFGPLVLLAMYAAMFIGVFRTQPAGMTAGAYVLYICAGIVPFLAFSATLTAGAGALVKNRQALYSTVFPAELLPVRAVLVASAILPAGLALVCVGALATGVAGWHLLGVPVVIALQTMFACGIAWVLAPVSAVVRDVQYMLQYVNMILIVVSPIGFTLDNVPALLKPLVYANPLTYFLASYQNLIVHDRLPAPLIMLACVVIGLVTFGLGYWVFGRARQVFIDYV